MYQPTDVDLGFMAAAQANINNTLLGAAAAHAVNGVGAVLGAGAGATYSSNVHTVPASSFDHFGLGFGSPAAPHTNHFQSGYTQHSTAVAGLALAERSAQAHQLQHDSNRGATLNNACLAPAGHHETTTAQPQWSNAHLATTMQHAVAERQPRHPQVGGMYTHGKGAGGVDTAQISAANDDESSLLAYFRLPGEATPPPSRGTPHVLSHLHTPGATTGDQRNGVTAASRTKHSGHAQAYHAHAQNGSDSGLANKGPKNAKKVTQSNCEPSPTVPHPGGTGSRSRGGRVSRGGGMSFADLEVLVGLSSSSSSGSSSPYHGRTIMQERTGTAISEAGISTLKMQAREDPYEPENTAAEDIFVTRIYNSKMANDAVEAVSLKMASHISEYHHRIEGYTKERHQDATADSKAVIVIGAGMAGCAAARRLEAAGQKVIVLEARLRVGGRSHSERWPTSKRVACVGGANNDGDDQGNDVPECVVDLGEQFIHGFVSTNPAHRMIKSNRAHAVQVQHAMRASSALPCYYTPEKSGRSSTISAGDAGDAGMQPPTPGADLVHATTAAIDPAVMGSVYSLLTKVREALVQFSPLQSGSRSARDRPRRQSSGDLPAGVSYPDSSAADTFDIVKAMVMAEDQHPPLTDLQDSLMTSVRARFLGAPMPLEQMSWHALQWLLRSQLEAPQPTSALAAADYATAQLGPTAAAGLSTLSGDSCVGGVGSGASVNDGRRDSSAAIAAPLSAPPSVPALPALAFRTIAPSAFVASGVGNLLKGSFVPSNIVLGAAVTEIRSGKGVVWRNVSASSAAAGGGGGGRNASTRGAGRHAGGSVGSNVDVQVKCANGQVYAGSHVLVTVPLGILQGRVPEAKIAFVPPLSRRKRGAIDKLGYGTVNKAILQFDPAQAAAIFPKTPMFHCTDPRFEFCNLDALSGNGKGLISVTIHAIAANEEAAAKAAVAAAAKIAAIRDAADSAAVKVKADAVEEKRQRKAAKAALDGVTFDSVKTPPTKKVAGQPTRKAAAAAAENAAVAAIAQVAASADVVHLGTDAETVQTIVGVLRQMFGARVPMPLRSKVTAWHNDPYAGNGNQPFRAVGSTADDVVAVSERQGQLFFAGDACLTGIPTDAGSAIDSGLEAAGEIMVDLGLTVPAGGSSAVDGGSGRSSASMLSNGENSEKEHPLFAMARKRMLDDFAGMNGSLSAAAVKRRRASFANTADSSLYTTARSASASRSAQAFKQLSAPASLTDGLAKGEIEHDAAPPVNSKIVKMVKEGTDGTGKDESKRFISCRAAMDFLGIQGHSTFYKCTREQIPFNGWLLVHNKEKAGAGGTAGGKKKSKARKKRR